MNIKATVGLLKPLGCSYFTLIPVSASSPRRGRMSEMKKDVTRLFKQFHPEEYQLELTPDRNTMTFSGTVRITGKKVGRPSQRLVFHQNGLKVTDVQIVHVSKKGESPKNVDRINLHDSYSEVRLHTAEMLYPGEYIVTMAFSGAITRNMEGIYPCFFTHDGKDKQLIATQFESHHARDAFPCIDEPEAKAVFELTVKVPKGEAVVSNTPIKQQRDDGDISTVLFEKTPKMSTYLLAFVCGEMKYKESKTRDGTVVRVYATPDNLDYTDFALESAVKTLEFYNQYYDIPYPLAKCDFLALPDFAAGAMENWGCITFREQALLVDPANTSTDMKQYVANVIAHELTHQWFGNLVTMRWWTDLWLNEGFASWMSYLAVDNLHPEWQVWPQFIGEDQAIGLKADALENTHPIEVPIKHPDEIRTIFDSISYDKGASVIHMLFKYLGETDFRDGLRHYLKKHAYGNTDGVDLWESLEHVSGKPVRSFMHSWVSLPGYPVVTATVSGKQLTLQQNRFLFDPEAKTDKHVWPVPIQPTSKLSADIFDAHKDVFESSDDLSRLIINDEKSGFYRTIYDSEHLQRLGAAVSTGDVSALNRYSILADAADAAKAGYGSTVDVLKLLPYYAQESNPVVWEVIAGTIGSVRAVMNDEALREATKPYMRSLVKEQLARLGWEPKANEPHFDTLLRPTIISLSASGEEPDTLERIQVLFQAIKAGKDTNPDLRGIVYGTVAYHGDESVYEELLELHNKSSSSEERLKLTAALTSFKQPELISRSLDLITTDVVRLQDVAYWIAYSFGNRFAKRLAWEWLQKNWDWLQKNIGKDLSFYRMPIYASRAFSDREFLAEFTEFFDANMGAGFERNIKQGAETIRWQAAWKDRDFTSVKAYFTELSA